MKTFIILIALYLPFSGLSQRYINDSKKDVKKGLTEYVSENSSLNASLLETDSTIILKIAGGPSLPAEFIYRFDKKGKCSSQRTITSCDSCLVKYLQSALDQKQYGWRKINENQYVSNFDARMLLEISAREKDFSFIIMRTDWTKVLYDMLSND